MSRAQDKLDNIIRIFADNPKQALKNLKREEKKGANPYLKVALADVSSRLHNFEEAQQYLDDLVKLPPVVVERDYYARLYNVWALNKRRSGELFSGATPALHKHFMIGPTGKKPHPDAMTWLFESALLHLAWKDVVVACRELKKQTGDDRNLVFFNIHACLRAAQQEPGRGFYSQAMQRAVEKQISTAIEQAVDGTSTTPAKSLQLSSGPHLQLVLEYLYSKGDVNGLRQVFKHDHDEKLHAAVMKMGFEYVQLKAAALGDMCDHTASLHYLETRLGPPLTSDSPESQPRDLANDPMIGDLRLWTLYQIAVASAGASSDSDHSEILEASSFAVDPQQLAEFIQSNTHLARKRKEAQIFAYLKHIATRSWSISKPPPSASWIASLTLEAPTNNVKGQWQALKTYPSCVLQIKNNLTRLCSADQIELADSAYQQGLNGTSSEPSSDAAGKASRPLSGQDNHSRVERARLRYTSTVSQGLYPREKSTSDPKHILKELLEGMHNLMNTPECLDSMVVLTTATLYRLAADQMNPRQECYWHAAFLMYWLTSLRSVGLSKAAKILFIRIHRLLGLEYVALNMWTQLKAKHFLGDAQAHWMFDRTAIQNPFAGSTHKLTAIKVGILGDNQVDVIKELPKCLRFYDFEPEQNLEARGKHLTPFVASRSINAENTNPPKKRYEISFTGLLERTANEEYKRKSLAKVMLQLELRRMERLRGQKVTDNPLPVIDIDALVDKREFDLLTEFECEPPHDEYSAFANTGPNIGPRGNKAYLRCWLMVDRVQSLIRDEHPMVVDESQLLDATTSAVSPEDIDVQNTPPEQLALTAWLHLDPLVKGVSPNTDVAKLIQSYKLFNAWIVEILPTSVSSDVLGQPVEYGSGLEPWSAKLQPLFLALEIIIHTRKLCARMRTSKPAFLGKIDSHISKALQSISTAEKAIEQKVRLLKDDVAQRLRKDIQGILRGDELFDYIASIIEPQLLEQSQMTRVIDAYSESLLANLDGVLLAIANNK